MDNIPCAPVGNGNSRRYVFPLLVIGWVHLALAAVIGSRLYVLLLLPAREAGIHGHALGERVPNIFTMPLLPCAGAICAAFAALILALRYSGKPRKRHAAILALATVCLIALHVIALQVIRSDVATYASGGGGSPSCVRQLNSLGMGLFLYARDHSGAFPDNLDQLIRVEGFKDDILICAWDDSVGKDHHEGTLPSSFVYLGKGMHEPLAPDAILIYETPGIHAADGMNLVYGDGSVQYVSGAMQILQDLSTRQQTGQPATSSATHPTR